MSTPSKHRDLLLIGGYFVAILLFAAVVTPPVFFAAQKIIAASPGGWIDQFLGHRAFPAYFNRVGLVAALVGLWPLFRMMKMRKSEVLGINASRHWLHLFVTGFVFAAGLLLIMGTAFIQVDAYRMKAEPRWLDLLSPITSALAVGMIEEFLFRGAILGILCRSLGMKAGLFWTTLFFAVVHFLKPPDDEAIANANVTWTTGFWVIPQLFRGFGQFEFFVEEFLTLSAVGFVLGWVRLRTGSLWGSIGLHAGWVFGLKYFGGLKNNTKALKQGDWIPWIGENLKIGLAPFAVVLLTGVIMVWWHRRLSGDFKKDIASRRS
ncbi:CPBP family intramembrane metalloprotease [Phragmitibacter flavus]|uniref:CPBP family intramembrane metalloprotease n=1 Tax=Phragmitibacter flavus TaxID=2576071 RepID=A0A5R8KKJ6_9BACT|nr:CPBP family intramembrane glutamic endopeptidase [Phragmitibacter flavus]TLD72854.1 CPBP family intramembrane metalloprotease [Phragmitibacter flavus]